jgi:uncharacterized protein (DUF2147 family)
MKKILVGVIIFMFVVFFSAAVKAESTIIGTWRTVEDEGPDKGKSKSHTEIFEKNGAYFAKVAKLLLKPQDTLCSTCTGDLKNKPVVGMITLKDMKKTGNVDEEFGEEYAGGTIMNPDEGKTYKCKIWVKGDLLTLRGYVGFLYRTQQWFRLK